jgi:hypothetical protein
VGKPEGKTPQGRQKRRSVANIKMDLRENRTGCLNWINLGLDRD